MKNFRLIGAATLLVFAVLFTISCSDDDSNPAANPTPSGELFLAAIDTAKIITMRADGTGARTIINKLENLNSYISDMSISHDGTKIAYTNYQRTFNPQSSTTELRVANSDGSGDHAVYTSSEPYMNILSIRFCSDNKIFFITETNNPSVRKMYTINPDGTGQEQIQGQWNLWDISDNRQLYLVEATSPSATVRIIDRSGDGGAGGPYHNEPFTAGQEFRSGTFTNDGTKVVIPFKEGNEIKARVIDVATKTSTNKTLVTGLGNGWLIHHLEMAADGKTGVVTLAGENYPKSKSYVFNLETGNVAQPFDNNDENVFNVYAH